MPADLAAFLTARLDEAETAAKERRGIFPSPGVEDNGAVWLHVKRGGNAVVVHYAHPAEGYGDMADLKAWAGTEHGWTQDRTLRSIAAKRAILADCTAKLRYPANAPLYNLAARTLRNLAAEWADHPDYQPERSPEPA